MVFVKGDPDVDYRYVAQAIDDAKGAGLDKVGIMTPKVEAGAMGANMKIRVKTWFAVILIAGALLLSSGCAKLQSRDHMNHGVQAYKNNHYADAVRHFKEAVTARSRRIRMLNCTWLLRT